MRKENPTRYSSAVGEAWQHAMFKVKYCHPIFDDKEVREETDRFPLGTYPAACCVMLIK